MNDHRGVLLVRDDGVIVVLDAVPIPTDWQQQIDTICDLLGAPQRNDRPEDEP